MNHPTYRRRDCERRLRLEHQPLPPKLLPETSHWAEIEGEVRGAAFYETSILWSRTLIQPMDAPMPKPCDFTGNRAG